MSKIVLYSTKTCPQCNSLKRQLDSKNIDYEVCYDEDLMMSKGIRGIPSLEIDGKILTNVESVRWVKEQ